VPYVRTVKTSSGATAVQIVHSSHRGSRDIEHLGSAHDDVQLELLKAARQQLAAGQGELDLGLGAAELAARGGRCRSPARGWAACWSRWITPVGPR
jgi:hypothetical protein